MKAKQTFLVILFVFSGWAIPLHAQEYDKSLLKDYVLPDITRKSLDLEVGSQGDYEKLSYDDSDDKSKDKSINGGLTSVFNYKKITRKYIGKQTVDLGIFGAKYESEENGNKSDDGYFEPQLSLMHVSRFYKNKLFFEIGGEVNIGMKNTFGNESYQERNRSVKVNIPLMVGTGRIEDVTDMRQAIYVAQALSKKGVLKQRISNEKMIEMAQLMSKVKNKRFLDHRLHLQDEITAVDSFLVNNNYIENTGAKYFTTLYDYWMYGDRFERRSGMEFKGGLTPLYTNGRNKNELVNIKSSQLGLNASVAFDYEEPLSLAWQQTVNVSLSGQYADLENKFTGNGLGDGYDTDSKLTSAFFDASYVVGYYPNTRTHLQMSIAESLIWQKNEFDDNILDVYNSYSRLSSTRLGFDAYYYISPQLRLSAEASLAYQVENNSDSGNNFIKPKQWNAKYTIGLTYSFF